MNKERKNIRSGSVCLIAMLVLMALPTTVFAVDPKIDLYVVKTDNSFKLKFRNSECQSGGLGCVDVAKGSKNWIFWEMDKDDWDNGWDLVDLQISWSTPAIGTCAVADFDLNPNTGYANDFRVQGGGKTAKNWDENNCGFAYEVNYSIYARNRITQEEANSDPIIRNGGRSGGGSH